MTADSDRQKVEGVIEAWNDSVNSNDSERILTLVSDDLEMIPPGAPPAQGDAAHKLLESFFEFDLNLNASTLELILTGDWAIRRYEYELTLTPKAGGESTGMRGQGIHLLRKEQDGSWRFAKDMWS